MDLNPLVNSCKEEIATDAELASWCNTNYGQGVKVYGNFDERRPPGEADCPCVAVFPNTKKYGGREYTDVIEFVCTLYDEAAGVHPGIDNIVDYAGVKNVEAMRKLVLAVIAAVIEASSASRITEVNVEYDTITYFPFVQAAAAVAIETPYTIGSGNPVLNE
jgi:hypothetical protein